MEPFVKLNGIVAPLDRVDVDTDQIIPKQFLKRIERTGFGQFLFFDWRFDSKGALNPEFELNRPGYKGATILASGRNFGSGSSREHAPWALLDYGFQCVIAPSFADIFYNNCFQNGILPLILPQDIVQTILVNAKSCPGYKLSVDLENQTVTDSTKTLTLNFEIDAFRRHSLLNGLDDIGLTLEHESEIRGYENK